MSTPPSNDIWLVEIDGAQYEADTETLTQWILDGYVTSATKVKKGSLQWIEAGRAPAFRSMFSGDQSFASSAAPSFPEPTSAAAAAPAYGFAPADASPPYGAAPAYAPAAQNVCATHPSAEAKFMCQGCGAPLCLACVKRYGASTAVCSLCGELCKPFGEAQATIRKTADRYSGFGLADFAAAFAYPLKDPLAFGMLALLYGILNLFGTYGRVAAAGILFASMSYAIRRVAMGHYDEGPSPDLSDPGEWIFEAAKCGIGVTLVTFGPLIAVVLYGFTGGLEDLSDLATMGVGVLLALIWAGLYYPMALLVAGYTADFLSIINPLVGLATMKQMGLTYVKAYFMCIFVLVLQGAAGAVLRGFDGPIEALPTLIGGVLYLVLSVAQGAVWFYASMVMAAVLGLAVYKKADALGVYVQ
jgi:hypothetical protein